MGISNKYTGQDFFNKLNISESFHYITLCGESYPISGPL